MIKGTQKNRGHLASRSMRFQLGVVIRTFNGDIVDFNGIVDRRIDTRGLLQIRVDISILITRR